MRQANRRLRVVEAYVRLRPGAALTTQETREEKHYSQRALGEMVRCSHATIGLIERGQMTTCSESLARNIAFYLGIPVNRLFTADDGSSLPKLATNQPVNRRRKRLPRRAAA